MCETGIRNLARHASRLFFVQSRDIYSCNVSVGAEGVRDCIPQHHQACAEAGQDIWAHQGTSGDGGVRAKCTGALCFWGTYLANHQHQRGLCTRE